MKKVLSVAAAVSLTLAMTACSKDTEPPSTPTALSTPTAQPATTMLEPPPDTLAGTPPETSATPGQSPTGTASTSPARNVDQSSPEAAMTSWLDGMLTGDSASVCALMAADGQAIEEIPKAVESCGKTIDPMLKQLKSLKGMFKDLEIEGATVNGAQANFENATATPAMAAEIIKQFKAVKVKGKWYITQ